jgi:hypothetical protein
MVSRAGRSVPLNGTPVADNGSFDVYEILV